MIYKDGYVALLTFRTSCTMRSSFAEKFLLEGIISPVFLEAARQKRRMNVGQSPEVATLLKKKAPAGHITSRAKTN
jgi:hypothetical protein